MTDEKAYSVVLNLTSIYNKSLTDEQLTVWLNEIKPLDEVIVQKVVNDIKLNNLYSNYMPNLPQFLQLYKRIFNDNLVRDCKDEYCYVCDNKGLEMIREVKIINDIKYTYDYFLHCNFCKKGEEQKISYKNLYTEPINKYLDIDKLIKKNKEKRKKQLENKNNSKHESIKIRYQSLMDIYQC
jgi:hypothetical protein